MNTKTLNFPIQGLSLITSCGCNLDCSYCRIAQARHDNLHTSDLQHETVKALQDGTFIENVRNVFAAIGQSTSQVESIAFWGQEPTLTLHFITEHLAEWFELFPNWRGTSFSTNGIAYPERLYDFVVGLDKIVDHDFQLNIQFSYDGTYSTESLRKTSGQIIHDNAAAFINKLNHTKLRHVFLDLHFHGVISRDLLKKLQTTEDIIKYQKGLITWSSEFLDLNVNNHVAMAPDVDFGLENPVDASFEEGMDLAVFLNKAMRIKPEQVCSTKEERDRYLSLTENLCRFITQPFNDILHELHHQFGDNMNFQDAIALAVKDSRFKRDLFNLINPMLYCGNGVGELKIMYDGTLINCQNHIFDRNIDDLPKDDKLETNVKRGLATHHYFINPLTATQKEIQDYFEYFEVCKFNSFNFIVTSTITLLEGLVKTQQVDSSYDDQFKLIEHAILASAINCCSFNNQMMSGSVYLRHTGFLRFYCNGFLDRLIDYHNRVHEMREGDLL